MDRKRQKTESAGGKEAGDWGPNRRQGPAASRGPRVLAADGSSSRRTGEQEVSAAEPEPRTTEELLGTW